MKKSEVSNYFFMVILAGIILVIILLLAGKLISSIASYGNEDDYTKFQREIKTAVESVSGHYGELSKKTLAAPEHVERLYIFDNSEVMKQIDFSGDPVIRNRLSSSGFNVFLMKGTIDSDTFRLSSLSFGPPHYVCVKNLDGKFGLIFQGKKDGALIKVQDAEADCTVPLLLREFIIKLGGSQDPGHFQERLEKIRNALKTKFPKINITHSITYNPVTDRTKVVVRVETELTLNNFFLQHFIPKCLMSYATEDQFLLKGMQPDVNMDIVSPDPMIGWHWGMKDTTPYIITYWKDKKVSEVCKELLFTHATGIDNMNTISAEIAQKLDNFEDQDEDGILNGVDALPGDLDNDGFSDEWEEKYQYNVDDPDDPSPNGDRDGDGLSDREEYNYGTDPREEDTDEDGMPDAWEVSYYSSPAATIPGLNPLKEDNEEDNDGDGRRNDQEYLAGTNPLIPD